MKNCQQCNKEYIVKKRNKCHEKGFCSYRCYRKTDEFKIKFKKTFIKNRVKDINVELISMVKIDELFHDLKSKSVKKSQSKRVKTIKNKGENEFSRMTKLGNRNRKINFLLNNNIITSPDEPPEKVDRLFNLYFNKITGHSNKVKKGIKNIYGDKITAEFQRRYKKAFLNFIYKEKLNINNLSISEYKELLDKFNKKHRYKDVLKWKKTHLVNQVGMERSVVENLTNEEICKKYSQYMCDRMKLVDNIYNGYRRTKKGYYNFINIDKKIFFRSSWEEVFLRTIDKLIRKKIVKNIEIPKFVRYYYNNIYRKYYPDFKIIFNYNFKVVEIKPLSKLKDEINIKKFKQARKLYGDKFKVLTEKEIFSDLELEIINMIGD